jgi:glycosyltransferase involved in cell wall biosynthesis
VERQPGPSAAHTALTSLAEPGGEPATLGEPAPLVTVITPAYNVAPYIGAAVDSVLGQRFSDFEYLVVDDGSTDETVAEVRQRRDPRLHLVMAPHGGSASARNAGLDRARGQFVAFLDGDDRWHPDFLGRQLAALQSAGPDVAAVFARSRVISETTRLYAFRWQRAGRYDFDDMLVDSCPPRTGSSLLIRKSAFDAAGYFRDEHTVPDLDMWLRIQRDSGMPYFVCTPGYLLDLRVRSGAISRDYRRRFEKLAHLIGEHAPDLRRYPAGMAYVRAAVFAFRAGNDDVALPWLQLARTAGLPRLLHYSYGWRLIGWSILPTRGRAVLRRLTGAIRGLIGRAIRAPGGLLR